MHLQIMQLTMVVWLTGCTGIGSNCSAEYDNYIRTRVKGKLDSAGIYLDQSISCDPKNQMFRFERAKFRFSQSDYAGAVNDIEDLRKHNDRPDMMLFHALLMHKLESQNQADDLLHKAKTTLFETKESQSFDQGLLYCITVYGTDNAAVASQHFEQLKIAYPDEYSTSIAKDFQARIDTGDNVNAYDLIEVLFN